MSERTLAAANTAIFQLQLNTADAVRYVVRNANCDATEANQALKQVMIGYKLKA